MEKRCATLDDLEKETTRFVESLVLGAEKATLVTLSGELGAGKTAFVKGIAKALGVTNRVTSPTFVLEKKYRLPSISGENKFKNLVHIDAYRLENGSALSTLGFDELMSNPKNLILLEWPEQVSDALPKPSVHIEIKILPDESRNILYA
ncbi:MAG TPA: tRNA (adenosine(37)-N6)-threonylcarbamoyltransferase complex ATPase subunit type 1 TsaE [Candidatus Kaiserbacteria bacterium]|nr:tRNA (adenosine(37)-N6)-threonylcarbamoyltransferase complex ATPase subunit type 1 TsaE [Candidatus Kaiserbacteria bacterium]